MGIVQSGLVFFSSFANSSPWWSKKSFGQVMRVAAQFAVNPSHNLLPASLLFPAMPCRSQS